MDTVKNPYLDVFEIWGEKMKSVVGDNYSMDINKSVAEMPFSRLYMLGNPATRSDLEGNEIATSCTFQVDSFAAGTLAVKKVYDIDACSHKAMVEMKFRRIYGPELTANADSNIKRVVSRYERVFTGKL